MASSPENISMAVFCDFENVALGVRDANYEKFDIKPVLERLLLKGSIVVKKAYCDWERYKGFKATMHEANFELIEIPHVRQSGKNSADIRLVVDALDLCYTKSHVNTFVIISGDSDFSPLVSKLRENNKQVIGVGVKQSTSDLLVANCDEFIFYDDLVREVKRAAAKRDERKARPAAEPKRAPDENNKRKEELEERKAKAIDMVVEMFDALVSERGDSGKIWASLLKDTLKRRRPDFNETYFGFRTFGNLLEEAQARGMLEFGRDEKSGAYVYRSERPVASSLSAQVEQMANAAAAITYDGEEAPQADDEAAPKQEQEQARRGRGRGGRTDFRAPAAPADQHDGQEEGIDAPAELIEAQPEPRRGRGRGGRTDFRAPVVAHEAEAPAQPAAAAPAETPWWDEGAPAAPEAAPEPEAETEAETPEWNDESPFPPPAAEKRSKPRSARKTSPKKSTAAVEAAPVADAVEAAPKAARKPAARSRRPAKPKAAPENS
ncbi:MAG TPA: NYN domain-containing protein [Telluria sp.]|nr:NYN domain-containing protein [Telluria sp.]